MPILEVTSLSTKGQVVIPNEIREKLHLEPGTKMIVIQDGDNILLKPIKAPRMGQFSKLIAIGDNISSDLGLKEGDIEKAIEDVRKNADRS